MYEHGSVMLFKKEIIKDRKERQEDALIPELRY
jgi:hypothetical protein